MVTYSSKTNAQGQDSRNLNHFRAFESLKDLPGGRPLVLDREFSYLALMLNFMEEQINWVTRLNLRSHPPKFYDADGKEVALTISPGETVILNRAWYMGKALVNLIGVWKNGLTEPMWIMINLEARRGLQIYFARMKIEETYRDLKSLLVFTIGLLVGKEVRDLLYGEPIAEDEQVEDKERIPGAPFLKKGKKVEALFGSVCAAQTEMDNHP